ncbi:MAG: FCD domain-containing protein [Proteobacteria bacterium]|nr:FCD domain-containing protein [Pseudomonadota bacterium]
MKLPCEVKVYTRPVASTSIRTALADAIREGLRRQNSTEARQTVQATHEAILEAIARGDGPSAERAMQAHFENAVHAIMNVDRQPG